MFCFIFKIEEYIYSSYFHLVHMQRRSKILFSLLSYIDRVDRNFALWPLVSVKHRLEGYSLIFYRIKPLYSDLIEEGSSERVELNSTQRLWKLLRGSPLINEVVRRKHLICSRGCWVLKSSKQRFSTTSNLSY